MATGVIEGKAIDIAIKAVPAGFSWLRKWWGSRTLLIVGQERAGKTNFFRFMRYGTLGRYGEKTPITNDPKKSDMFTVMIGSPQRPLTLTIRKTTDLPGQIGPREHAKRVVRERPDVVVVILDMTTPQDGTPHGAFGTWYEEFCSSIYEFSSKKSGIKDKPFSILTLLNKYDEFTKSSPNVNEFEDRKKHLRELLNRWLRTEYGPRISQFEFLPSCIVEDPDDPNRCDRRMIEYAFEKIGLLFG